MESVETKHIYLTFDSLVSGRIPRACHSHLLQKGSEVLHHHDVAEDHTTTPPDLAGNNYAVDVDDDEEDEL